MTPETRDALLVAIAKSRGWIEDLRQEVSRLSRSSPIAKGLASATSAPGPRSPRVPDMAPFVSGASPTDLIATGLAKALPPIGPIRPGARIISRCPRQTNQALDG